MTASVGMTRTGVRGFDGNRHPDISSSGRGDNADRICARRMTPELVAECCKDRQMWSQPQLNTQLFLNYKGFETIEGLEDYVKVRCLHLGNNNIVRLEGLERMTDLRTLHLECNRILKIENLERNLELRQLNLEGNAIKHVSGISQLPKLENIILANNAIEHLEDLQELHNVPGLSNVDVSNNLVEETEGVIEFWEKLQELRVLRFHGNPGVRHVAHYRKRLINSLPKLSYLDERPVFPVERRSSAAWAEGGQEAMHKARQEFVREKNASNGVDPERREHLTKQRQLAIARIEREAREREAKDEERQAQQGAVKERSSHSGESMEEGNLNALAEYEKTWQTRVNLHGLEGVRAQVADSSKTANNVRNMEPTPDATSQTAKDKAKAALKAAETAASAARSQPAYLQSGRSDHGASYGDFRPPPRSVRETSSADSAASTSRGRITPTGLWAHGASHFRARPDGGALLGDDTKADIAAEDEATVVYRHNEERQFAILGDDPWGNSSIGSRWQTPTSTASAKQSPGAGTEELVPDLWKRNAAANAQAEKEALEMNFRGASESREHDAPVVQSNHSELLSLD